MIKSGLGATPHDDGVTFGVWAPFATAVAVTGDFNNWSHDATPLSKHEDGCWFAFVPGAKAGQEYKYVITNGEHTALRNDPRALQLTASDYNAVIVDDQEFDWQGDDFTIPETRKLVIYEMHIGTFNREDPTISGTFTSAIAKLDHLKSLGVNAVEVMPCNVSKSDLWWGYTPDFIYAVDVAYGGRRAFKEFVKAAHARGIAVVLDVVYNHLAGRDLDGPSRDDGDIWRFDGWYENEGGGIYFYNDHRAHTPWGETRLDYGRPEVRRYLLDNALTWVKNCHVDGLRVDSTIHIRRMTYTDDAEEIPDGWKLLTELTQTVKKQKPHSILIAEDLKGNPAITKPVKDDGGGFDAQWEPWLGSIMHEVANTPDSDDHDLVKITEALTGISGNDPFKKVIYTESHDLDANGGARLNEVVTPGKGDSLIARRRSVLAAAVMFTMPNIPMLFQGQEFLEGGSFNHWQPLRWQNADKYHGIFQLYSDLIHLRRNMGGLTKGLLGTGLEIVYTNQQTKVFAYRRWDEGGPNDDVVVVMNLMNQGRDDDEIPFPTTGTWKVRFNSDWGGYSDDFTNTSTPDVLVGDDKKGKVNVGPYSIIILSQD